MIDTVTRAKLREKTQMNTLVQGLKDTISSQLQTQNPNEEVLKLVVKREEEKELLDGVRKIGSALALLYKMVSRPIVLPKIFKVEGRVEVTRPVTIRNLQELGGYFKSLEEKMTVWAQAASTAPAPVINVPKIEIPKFSKSDNSKVEELLQDLNEKIGNLKFPEVKFPKSINVDNFPITHTPQPVTNININPLQGVIKTTSATVGTTVTQLPAYGQLFNRRSLIIYNNSANTIYVGGSDVSTTNGFPITSNNFGPVIDAGYNMIVYAIASQGGNNVRVIEVATRSDGGTAIQE